MCTRGRRPEVCALSATTTEVDAPRRGARVARIAARQHGLITCRATAPPRRQPRDDPALDDLRATSPRARRRVRGRPSSAHRPIAAARGGDGLRARCSSQPHACSARLEALPALGDRESLADPRHRPAYKRPRTTTRDPSPPRRAPPRRDRARGGNPGDHGRPAPRSMTARSPPTESSSCWSTAQSSRTESKSASCGTCTPRLGSLGHPSGARGRRLARASCRGRPGLDGHRRARRGLAGPSRRGRARRIPLASHPRSTGVGPRSRGAAAPSRMARDPLLGAPGVRAPARGGGRPGAGPGHATHLDSTRPFPGWCSWQHSRFWSWQPRFESSSRSYPAALRRTFALPAAVPGSVAGPRGGGMPSTRIALSPRPSFSRPSVEVMSWPQSSFTRSSR